jgi:hypothetical protein
MAKLVLTRLENFPAEAYYFTISQHSNDKGFEGEQRTEH